ncbi:sigma-70 family RNA polymerase sigma factor [Streptomyces lunaelactis]|uniref:Sigma-70 family RNA polymerase sigma factor n=1 Tax=Streptomyces lunaelactis TaxID=1535768 RepID=A0A2R4SWX7_9ACTN|nr:sigma-70 family RNA polymerase sigma factor [Streptomyces lunaelactis]AVZ71368.1 sigma-70 family RNA polymerase sigma factor [Streptomyces lunaelactis]NUK83658.1 sigma-70 family RNA polymerase sigma factor [Streptomyces lunaelactis]
MSWNAGEAGRIEDAVLTRAAQAGETAALGLLLERHRAGMRAVALSILGPGPDVDDMVQDAAVTALRRVGDVRDPAAVGAWLRMIVRNASRSLLRSSVPSQPIDGLHVPSTDAGPEQWLEHHTMRNWIWEAIEGLSPALRLPLVLRHFSTGVTSYERIADACGVPVGTVRSRLNQGRAKLATALAATADAPHGDTAQRIRASRVEARETLAAAESGRFGALMTERWSPEIALLRGNDPVGGRSVLVRGMDGDLEAGVRQRLVHAVAGRSLVVWEMELLNPADNPGHCPPSVAWLMTLDDAGRPHRLRLLHPRPVQAIQQLTPM